jgi:hypothetical protein
MHPSECQANLDVHFPCRLLVSIKRQVSQIFETLILPWVNQRLYYNLHGYIVTYAKFS